MCGHFVLGVMLVEAGDPNTGFAGIRFRRDLHTLLLFDPKADLNYLEALEADIRTMLQSVHPEYIDSDEPISRREWIISRIKNDFSDTVTVVDVSEVFTDSPEEEIERLVEKCT